MYTGDDGFRRAYRYKTFPLSNTLIDNNNFDNIRL